MRDGFPSVYERGNPSDIFLFPHALSNRVTGRRWFFGFRCRRRRAQRPPKHAEMNETFFERRIAHFPNIYTHFCFPSNSISHFLVQQSTPRRLLLCTTKCRIFIPPPRGSSLPFIILFSRRYFPQCAHLLVAHVIVLRPKFVFSIGGKKKKRTRKFFPHLRYYLYADDSRPSYTNVYILRVCFLRKYYIYGGGRTLLRKDWKITRSTVDVAISHTNTGKFIFIPYTLRKS